MSRTFRQATAASAVALAALAACASSAQADTQSTLQYGCKYPLVDKKPLQVDVKTNIPAFAKVNELQPAFKIDAIATAKDGTSEAIDTLDAYKLGGTGEARASLVFPSGFVQGNLKVPLTINPYNRVPGQPIPDPLILTATGQTPAVTLDELGITIARLDKISLNLAAFYDDGSPINVKKLLTDYDGNPAVDSDGNVNTFDVYCKLNADQSSTIAEICVNETGLPDNSCSDEPSNLPPTKVTGLKVDSVTSSSATISWSPSTDPDNDPVSYNVYLDGSKVATVTGTSRVLTGLSADVNHTVDVEATDGVDNAAKSNIAFKVGTPADTIAPSAPTPKIDAVTTCPQSTVTISWTASTDTGGSGLKGYVITYKGQTINVPAGTTTHTFQGVSAGPFEAEVAAIDNAGNLSAGQTVTAIVEVADCVPSAPIVTLGAITAHSVTLNWSLPAPGGTGVAGYNVFRNGTKVNTSLITGTTYTDTGLTAKTAYSYQVEAVGTGGSASAKSPAVTVTTPDDVNPSTCPQGFACYDYSAKGSTALRTLTTGTLPLAGGIKAQLAVATGAFTADLTLNNTSGRLTAAGFLPLTAKVGFVPVGKTTGQLDDATATKPQSISTNSKVRIKVLEVKLFGAIPLAGGNSCQTKSLSDINLKSTNAFDPLKGGTIGGTYAISDLNGCGPLNGLVSPLTAGGGNTISLTLTKLP